MSNLTGLKICLNSEIRKISKVPADLKGLTETITTLFGANLPKKWALQYVDCDGDNITISKELDFKEFVEEGNDAPQRIIKKVFIVELPEEQVSLYESLVKEEARESKSEMIETKEVLQANPTEAIQEVVVEETVPEPKSPHKESLETEEVGEETLSSGTKSRNQKSERRANKVVKKFAQAGSPKTNERLKGKLRELGKCLTAEQKEELERKKNHYINNQVQKVEEFPTINEAHRKKIVHTDVRCDGCQQFPIVGIRYKCSQCADFDYCEGCEARFEHHHPFIQMKKPEEKYSGSSSNLNRPRQADRKWKPFPTVMQNFIAALEDEDNEEENGNDAPHLDENQHEKVADTLRRIYASEVQEKAQRLSEIFPDRRPQDFHAFVSKAHHLSLEALIEKWLLA